MRKVEPTDQGVRRGLPQRKILYVEDNDDNWVVAELRLGKQFDLLRARTDREACELLVQHGDGLSGVLMDIELLGSTLNGIDLVRLIRGRIAPLGLPEFARRVPTLAVPILFVTAHGQTYSKAELLGAGGDALITKPVDFKVLNMELMRLHVGAMKRS